MVKIMDLPNCETLFWGGVAVAGTAVFLMAACCVIFYASGRKLKKRLEEEYGKPYC